MRMPPQVAATARASGFGKPGAPATPVDHVLQADLGEQGDTVPLHFAVQGGLVAAGGQLRTEQGR